jgi:hypothetical protein
MCGGGGPSGDTKYNWNDTLAPAWQSAISQGQGLAANNPYKQYDATRIAPFSNDQNTAMARIRSFADAGGTGAGIAANNQSELTNENSFLFGPLSYQNEENQYSGYGPQFQQNLQGQLDDIKNAYQSGTAADTTRMFNLSGAFGGSAHQKAMANNEAALARQLGNTTSQAYQDQFNRSAGLDEARIGRGLTSYEGERNRQMQALAPGQNANNMFLQGANALMGIGDANRGRTQDLLNMSYQDWLDQNNQPFKNMDWLTGLFSRAQGGMSPNSSTTSSGYAASPISQLLGAGLLYKGLG